MSLSLSPTPRFDWRRGILYTHRWLGIAGGVLFLLGFLSGIVMLYARMPSLDPAERLRRLPELDLSSARVPPGEAARALGIVPERLRVGMLGQRPVYRFADESRWTAAFADDGEPLTGLTTEEAMRLARRLFPEHAATARHDGRLEQSDQWTIQSRGLLPLHRVALGDSEDTRIYLSERTGEAVMSATRGERRWAYAGAVPHWLYFTPFRRHGALWNWAVVLLSLAGCVLAASGLVWGVWQAARATRQLRESSRRVAAGAAEGADDGVEDGAAAGAGRRRSRAGIASPYAGWMRWHHYAGLVFGLFTFTWVLSGGLSMEPFDWHPGTGPTLEQARAVAGGPLRVDALTLDGVRAASSAIAAAFPVKELELLQFRSEPFLLAYRAPDAVPGRPRAGYEPSAFLSPVQPFEHRLVSALHPERGVVSRFDDDDVAEAARAAMPHARLLDAVWLDRHDAYYYDSHGVAPLPVLRARFDDAGSTWLYLDPGRGMIVRKEETLSRLNRWLYHGLHSFDFRFLRQRRSLRDAIVIVLCLGGILIASTSIGDGWRRVARHLRRR